MRRATSRMKGIGYVVVAALAVMSDQATAQPSPARQSAPGSAATPSVPAPAVLLMLIRTTFVALNQANFTGNYTVLHGLGTPQLQARNQPADLAIAFHTLRNQRLDLSPVLVVAPELSEAPHITPDGALRIAGVFRTQPVQISFVALFRPVAGIWRIEGLSVASRAAPAPAQPNPKAVARQSWQTTVIP